MEIWERNRYDYTSSSPTVTHEMLTTWMDKVDGEPSPWRRSTPATVALSPSDDAALVERAAELAAQFGLREPSSIRWATIPSRWGECRDGHIKIASIARALPGWVTDVVIVHELCHLEVRGHGPEFKELVNRHPLAREADGYLACVQQRDWGIDAIPDAHNPKDHDVR